ncbi:hypothetical protein BCV72DRAFT_300926 [Rhizopus microsporus var. microsporus]|uniref:SET domain-containing protein n=1 Tax=Rhizopus microsporus var. microsporus TaxID=86635 RepID=A0A1X0RH60_RHIZD|nr:hypothetical protein BCV72DRAFT_300926 [Rhizopus microsporus var. microsporus]
MIFLTDRHRAAIRGLIRQYKNKTNKLKDSLLDLDCFRRMEVKELREFKKHLSLYCQCVHSSSGVEFRTTKVYTGSPEVKMVASEVLGTPMYLTRCASVMAKVTEQLDIGDDCWWVISRRGQDYVLPSPIRFFIKQCYGKTGSMKLAPRINTKVKAKDEITLFYGGDYFGKNNVECRCFTCRTIKGKAPSQSSSRSGSKKH